MNDMSDSKDALFLPHQNGETIEFNLYLSGPIDVAKQTIRAECLADGLCVTVTPTLFIYTGGEENGYVVGIRNYPRFPSDIISLRARAVTLMQKLLDATMQHSAMLVGPHETTWITKRK